MSRTDYSAGDLDVTMAQRQSANANETFIAFQSTRSLDGSADASFSFGTRASRPVSGAQGDRYLATDIGTQGGWLYYWTGTAWEIVIGWASGANAVRAAIAVSSVDNGAWFYATDTAKFWEVAGGAWVDRTPAAGTVSSFSATPTGIFDVATATTAPALSLDNQSANTTLAGPASGGAATPSFRALVAADVPFISSAQSSLAAEFTLASAAGTYDDTGLSVSLPAAGTYLLFADVRGVLTGNAGTFWYIAAKLRNSTDAADIADSEVMVVLTSVAAKLTQTTVPITAVPVVVAGAKTIKLYVKRDTDGSFTTSKVGADANGRTRLSYLRIA
jgi:hypothetical protein